MKNSIPTLHKLLLAVYVLAILWTSFSHSAEYRVRGGPISPYVALPEAASNPHGRLNVRAYVQGASQAAGVNPRISDWIVSHESRHHPEATGDGGESRGL